MLATLLATLFYRSGFPFSMIDGAEEGSLAGNNHGGLDHPSSTKLHPERFRCAMSASVLQLLALDLADREYLPFAATTNFKQEQWVATPSAVRRLGSDMSIRRGDVPNHRASEFPVGPQRILTGSNHRLNYGAPYPNTNAESIFGQAVITQTSPTSPYGAFGGCCDGPEDCADPSAKITAALLTSSKGSARKKGRPVGRPFFCIHTSGPCSPIFEGSENV